MSTDSIETFRRQVEQQSRQRFPDAPIESHVTRHVRINLRVECNEDTFVDIFYNALTDRQDFALIHRSSRVFGIDNLGGWHVHPLADPSEHRSCDDPEIDEVFRQLREAYDALNG
ncbi:MAG: hypothetical protein ABEK03_10090 [Candidatus Bipolaricaulia bacterium]